jgi:hypothetical protein
MAAVVVEMERMGRIVTVREVFGLSCRMNWRGWKRRMKTSLWSRKSRSSSRRNDSRKNDRSGRMRRKMKRRKGGDNEPNSGDRGRPSRRV